MSVGRLTTWTRKSVNLDRAAAAAATAVTTTMICWNGPSMQINWLTIACTTQVHIHTLHYYIRTCSLGGLENCQNQKVRFHQNISTFSNYCSQKYKVRLPINYSLIIYKHQLLTANEINLRLGVSICLDVVSIEISISTPKKYQSRRDG